MTRELSILSRPGSGSVVHPLSQCAAAGETCRPLSSSQPRFLTALSRYLCTSPDTTPPGGAPGGTAHSFSYHAAGSVSVEPRSRSVRMLVR